jgi:hypothetical protein
MIGRDDEQRVGEPGLGARLRDELADRIVGVLDAAFPATR